MSRIALASARVAGRISTSYTAEPGPAGLAVANPRTGAPGARVLGHLGSRRYRTPQGGGSGPCRSSENGPYALLAPLGQPVHRGVRIDLPRWARGISAGGVGVVFSVLELVVEAHPVRPLECLVQV